jgi:hypothetical protein
MPRLEECNRQHILCVHGASHKSEAVPVHPDSMSIEDGSEGASITIDYTRPQFRIFQVIHTL